MPPAIPVWAEALKNVDISPKRRHQQHANLCVGYQFPDPHLFLNTGRRERYLCAWLTVRAGWIQSVLQATSSEHLPMTQQWRDFLHKKIPQQNPGVNLSARVPIKTSKQSTQRRKQRITQQGAEIFQMRLPEVTLPHQVFWQEHMIQVGDECQITPTLSAQILWDLFEHNFRLELLALEHIVMAREWEDPEKAAKRDNLVRAVFPGDGGYFVGPLPSVDCGLAATSWEDRLLFVENFRVLVSGWDGEVPEKLRDVVVSSKEDVEYVEKVAVSHYCQTFFDWFGRAAICPHRLPPPLLSSSSTTSAASTSALSSSTSS
jgi:hypothetical protein